MKDSTDLDLDVLEAIVNATPDGPWLITDGCMGDQPPTDDESAHVSCGDRIITGDDRGMRIEVARLIVAAHEAIPALIKEVRALRAAVLAEREARAKLAESFPTIDHNDAAAIAFEIRARE